MAFVEIERVRYRYPDAAADALDDINLKFEAGEFVVLAGASGSGKSSLCRLLNGLIPHFHGGTLEGIVRIDGVATRAQRVSDLFARVGLVFQNPDAQLFNSTVEREIAFGLEGLGLPRAEIRARVEWALDTIQLARLRDRAPHSLSGGEQQLVALAAIIALRPRLLVLDEPFANLDPGATACLRSVLRALYAQGTTVILTEHRLHTTIEDATRLIVLDRGHVARDGAPRQVLREDVSQFRLNLPFVVRVAHASGWDRIPLSVDEAVVMARARGGLALSAPRDGSRRDSESSRVVEMGNVAFAREGREILQDISFDVRRGQCVALVGMNGAGKTTLLKHLNGLHRPSRGTIRVLNQDTRRARVSDLAAHVGFVFQNPNDQLFKPNVREEVEIGARALERFDDAWLKKLYDWFALIPFLDRSPFALSEGEKKRVALAAALAARPAILALDEPTTGQDFAFRASLARVLDELQNAGMTIICATHDLEFAEQVAPRWLVMADGKLVADAAPEQVMQNEMVLMRAALTPTARFRLQQELAQYELGTFLRKEMVRC